MKTKSVRKSLWIVLLTVLVLSTSIGSLPPKVLAASGRVTITDKMTYASGVPSDIKPTDDAIILIPKNVSGIPANSDDIITPTSVSVSGNIATFTAIINKYQDSSNNINKTPVPVGSYTATSFPAGQTSTFNVDASGNGKTTINSTYNGGFSSFGNGVSNASGAINAICGANAGTPECTTQVQNLDNFGGGPCATGAQTDANGNPCNPPNSNPSVSCGSKNTSLSWIICPVFEVVQDAANTMSGIITDLLKINVGEIFTGQTGDAYKGAWSALRNIALIVIVIVALIMIIAQAVGSQAIDAYTIKSVLPRLLIAAIIISLSWWLLEFFVNLSNILGLGIRELIYAPFSALNAANNNGAVLIGQNPITILMGGVALVVGVGLLLAFAGTIALALAIGLAVIVLRQVVVVFLIIIAPIAIALYALPNTQKVATMWWDSFIKALLMFPIIVGFIAIGKVFALTSMASGTTGDGTLKSIVATIAYIIPFFLLPFTFKMAGGAMGGIAQGIHGAADPLRKRINKRRGERWADRGNRFKSGELKGPGKVFNGIGQRVGVGATGFYGVGRRGRQAMTQQHTLHGAAFGQSNEGKALQHNDGALRAMTYSSATEAREGLARDFGMNDQEIKDSISAVKASGGFNSARQNWAAQQLAVTGTGYDDLDQVASTIHRVSHGNESTRHALAGNINSTTKQVGRPDLAPGYSNLDSLASAVGTGAYEGSLTSAQYEATKGMDMVTQLRGKPKEMETTANVLGSQLDSARNTMATSQRGSEEWNTAADRAKHVIGQINQLDSQKTYGSPQNQDIVNELVRRTSQGRDEVIQTLTGGHVADRIVTNANGDRYAEPIYGQEASSGRPNQAPPVGYQEHEKSGKEHIEDIQRYSSSPQYAGNPDSPVMQRPEPPSQDDGK